MAEPASACRPGAAASGCGRDPCCLLFTDPNRRQLEASLRPLGFSVGRRLASVALLWHEPCQLLCACCVQGEVLPVPPYSGLSATCDMGSGSYSADEGRAQRLTQLGRSHSGI